MSALGEVIDFFLHLDVHLGTIIQEYGTATYSILFLIVFFETGIVVAPFLPGDSLLFITGTLAGTGVFNIWLVGILLSVAAILGDTVNYWLGHHIGRRLFKKDSRFFKMEYLEKTKEFYEKHGGKTVIIGRFLPIIRTFAPFVAGIGHMKYTRFILYNIVGGILWVGTLLLAGFLLGSIPFVKENLSLIILSIIVLSVITTLILHQRRSS